MYHCPVKVSTISRGRLNLTFLAFLAPFEMIFAYLLSPEQSVQYSLPEDPVAASDARTERLRMELLKYL